MPEDVEDAIVVSASAARVLLLHVDSLVLCSALPGPDLDPAPWGAQDILRLRVGLLGRVDFSAPRRGAPRGLLGLAQFAGAYGVWPLGPSPPVLR